MRTDPRIGSMQYKQTSIQTWADDEIWMLELQQMPPSQPPVCRNHKFAFRDTVFVCFMEKRSGRSSESKGSNFLRSWKYTAKFMSIWQEVIALSIFALTLDQSWTDGLIFERLGDLGFVQCFLCGIFLAFIWRQQTKNTTWAFCTHMWYYREFVLDKYLTGQH